MGGRQAPVLKPCEENIFMPPGGGRSRLHPTTQLVRLLVTNTSRSGLSTIDFKQTWSCKKATWSGTLQTLMPTLSMSAFGGKADMAGPLSNVR